MILPIIDIGDVFYHNANKSSLEKLRVLQNRAIRSVYNMRPRENTDQAEKKLNLLKPEKRRQLHVLQLAKWMADSGAHSDNRTLSTRSHAPGRRALTVPHPRKSLFLHSFYYQACKTWNDLPIELHREENNLVFKNIVRDMLFKEKLQVDV